MATINFLYRSTKDKAPLNLRLLFRYNSKDYVIGARTRIIVSKQYWKNDHDKKRPKDIAISNKQVEVNKELNLLEAFLLDEFYKYSAKDIDKNWLKARLEEYYRPTLIESTSTNSLVGYFNAFLEAKSTSLKPRSITRYATVRNLLMRYDSAHKQPLMLVNVDQGFQKAFLSYGLSEGYSKNTIARAIRTIKTVCFHAESKGKKVSPELRTLGLRSDTVKHLYLTFDDLEKIKRIDTQKMSERLDNARDWLIISCYTGQRVSDFMRFNAEMIRSEGGKSFIEFKQQKTGQLMTVPIHKEVSEILGKRDGLFPRSISEQRYNEYIKEVCKIAGLNKIIDGAKRLPIEGKENTYRKVFGKYPKWELVTSHIGRRSFATNHYGQIPTVLLMSATGHRKESTFLAYIGKGNKDLAIELSKYF